ncbi:MAG: hypothetical protein KJ752_01620, partial [Alphaproteobacteria bacterium]|nr:hypothetical protein [Alphaproteobacteria bacterium]
MTVTIEKGGPLAVPLEDLKRYLGISLADEDAALTDLLRHRGGACDLIDVIDEVIQAHRLL